MYTHNGIVFNCKDLRIKLRQLEEKIKIGKLSFLSHLSVLHKVESQEILPELEIRLFVGVLSWGCFGYSVLCL